MDAHRCLDDKFYLFFRLINFFLNDIIVGHDFVKMLVQLKDGVRNSVFNILNLKHFFPFELYHLLYLIMMFF